MHYRVIPPIMLAEFVDLGMAVVTACNAVISSSGFDLGIFNFSVFKTLVFEPGLQEAAAAATTVIVGPVGLHVYKIFFPYNGFDNKS